MTLRDGQIAGMMCGRVGAPVGSGAPVLGAQAYHLQHKNPFFNKKVPLLNTYNPYFSFSMGYSSENIRNTANIVFYYVQYM